MKCICSECGSSDITANVWVPVGEHIIVNSIEYAEYYWCGNCDKEVEVKFIKDDKHNNK